MAVTQRTRSPRAGGSRPPRLRRLATGVVVAVASLHAAIHAMGVVKGVGWAEIEALEQPVGTLGAVGWLAATVVMGATAALLAAGRRWWWMVGAVAVVASQAMIVTAWSDAAAGTVANVVVGLAVVHGWASQGPRSAAAEYRRRSAAALSRVRRPDPSAADVVTSDDLDGLPRPVADYVVASGAIGLPRVASFSATISGRIRKGPDDPWMTFTGAQTNTFGAHPTRTFFMDATKAGLPVDVLHVYDDGRATMRVTLLSLFTMVDESGPLMDRAETVTVFNDLCLFAPAALVDAGIDWESLDDRSVRGTFTVGDQVVTATLQFDANHHLVDFVSDDRGRADDGLVPQTWSTPITAATQVGQRRVIATGEARWLDPRSGEWFTYLEVDLDSITYDPVDAV